MPRHVFISYQRKDADLAASIAVDLLSDGLEVFIDRDIRPGESWDERLESALASSFAVVALWSENSVTSPWVRREAREARERGILCPAILDSCRIPLEFRDIECAILAGRRAGDREHSEWRLLVKSLQAFQQGPIRDPLSQEARVYYELGLKFLNGDRCPPDKQIALRYFQKALAAGHPNAQKFIGEIEGSL
jgi:sulfatase modifying factor 1